MPLARRLDISVGRIVGWTLALAGLALLLPRLVQFVQITTTFIAWPWQFDFTEGINLNATDQLAAGHNIYRHATPDSFISAPYTPVFYLLNAPFEWLNGPSFAAGRTMSLLATVIIALLLAYVVGRLTSHWLAGTFAGALWLSLSPVIVWSALYTQHIMALAFALGGLVWVMLRPTSRHFYMAPVLFALAFFTKQSAVDMAAAAALWLLLTNWRAGVRFAITLGACVGVPFLAIDLITRHGFWEHVIANQQVLESDDRRWRRMTGHLFDEYWPLIGWGMACALGGMGYLAARFRKSRLAALGSPWGVALIYFVVAQVWVLYRIGREGVSYNHFIDALLPGCLVLGLSLGWLLGALEGGEARRRLYAAGGVVVLSAVVVAQLIEFADPHTWYSGPWPGPVTEQQMQVVSQYITSTPGDIYSEDVYQLLIHGRPVLYDDDFMFMALARLHRWDDSVFAQRLRDRSFSLIVMQYDSTRIIDAGQNALDANYGLKYANRFDVYVPKPVPDRPQYTIGCTLSGNGDSFALDGYSLPPGVAVDGVQRGTVLHTTLYWEPQRQPAGDYATHVQLLNEQGDKVSAQDNPHTGAKTPTNRWQPGQVTQDIAAVPIPADLPPGRYRLIAGMYRLQNGQIAALESTCPPEHDYGAAVSLGWVVVK